MMRSLRLCLPLWLLVLVAANLGTGFDHKHTLWSQVLKSYVNPQGLVNYHQLQHDLQTKSGAAKDFQAYLAALASPTYAAFSHWTSDEQKAFLINAYNAFTIDLILRHYDDGKLTSIKDIGHFLRPTWKIDFLKLLPLPEGKGSHYSISNLDMIEHEYLRPRYKDYRIHAAINCASLSCPSLRREAYVGADLERQLDEQMHLWLADSSLNSFDMSQGKLKISKIFDWFAEDFGGDDGVWQVMKKFGPPPMLAALKAGSLKSISYLTYNWTLNNWQLTRPNPSP